MSSAGPVRLPTPARLPGKTRGMTTAPDDLLPIVQCGDPVLRTPAAALDPADVTTAEIQQLIARMRATMVAAPGVGLAAPQVGVGLAIAVLADGPDRWTHSTAEERAARERTEVPFTVLVNPVVTPLAAGQPSFYEACLSVPGITGVVPRAGEVAVSALDAQGRPVEARYRGWPARIVQHEVDHLNGVLYLDRVLTRSVATAEIYAERWAGRSPAEAARALGFSL